MFNIFAIGKSGMNAYQEKLDYLSNDLVNSETTGYKSSNVGFKDLMTESLNRLGTPIENKNAVSGTGIKTGINYSINTQGNISETKQKTDLAIEGKGYFAINKPDGSIAYTRDGNFQIDSDGTLTNSNGEKVYIQYEDGYGEGNPQLESDKLSVDSDGGISTVVDGQTVKIGNIPLFTAIGDKSLLPIGNNEFVASSDAQITLSNDYNIVQGALEGSNVDTTQVFSDIILTQRAFQMSSKAITTADDIWSMINQMKG